MVAKGEKTVIALYKIMGNVKGPGARKTKIAGAGIFLSTFIICSSDLGEGSQENGKSQQNRKTAEVS